MEYKGKKHLELLFFSYIEKEQFYATNDPLAKIIFSFNDIEIILKNDCELNAQKILFSSGETIHKILYDEDLIIFIKYNNNKKGLSTHFYFNLLLKKNPDIIDYSYSIDYIIEANNERKQLKDNKLKNIIMAKCINDLINYYKETEEYKEEKDDDVLNTIEEENLNIIKNSLDIFNIFGLNFDEKKFEKIEIDEIYIEIIISLIKGRKLDDYEYSSNIFNQLDLISIDLTKKMFVEIIKVLNEKEKYISDYIILKFDDLYDEKKVNFYFFLLYFILKTPFYFYQIPFFLETKKVILQNLKLINLNQLKKINGNKNYIKKFEYIIKTLSDSEYYWKKYLKYKFLEIKEIQTY